MFDHPDHFARVDRVVKALRDEHGAEAHQEAKRMAVKVLAENDRNQYEFWRAIEDRLKRS